MADPITTVRLFAGAAANLVPHHFTVIDALDDGTPIPIEALSDDHSIGIYGEIAPRMMREHAPGYVPIDLSELRPKSLLERGTEGASQHWLLEYVPFRGVRFRAEELQYLEQGWAASLPEVTYPAETVLALAHLTQDCFGASSSIYLNKALPMPLWIRSHPMSSAHPTLQFAIQVRAGGRMRPTNIHTECPMEYARRWVTAARTYYDVVPEEPAR